MRSLGTQSTRLTVLALFFVSGMAALVYQVLWLRELGLLFGNTAEAAAVTIAIFFAGVASGGWYWGRRARRYRKPLIAFGALELGVAATALLFFLLSDAYRVVYPGLHDAIAHSTVLVNLLKLTLSALVLFPPAFLMGGTFPLVAEHVIRQPDQMARQGSLLYALNTLGGMTGAFIAAFILPMALGFTGAYMLAISLDLAVGLSAVLLGRRWLVPEPQTDNRNPAAERQQSAQALPLRPAWLWTLAFVSGALTLAVEVIWTRMYAQVLQNSVYTYATVLILFLLSLGLGSVVANRLSARQLAPIPVTVVLLVLSGVAAMSSPWLFQTLTEGMTYLDGGESFAGYMTRVFITASIVIVPAGILLGSLLPWLLSSVQSWLPRPGQAVGQLIAANTVGAILGALVGGFVLLNLAGVWLSLQLIGIAYGVLALATLWLHPMRYQKPALAIVAGLVLVAALPDFRSLQSIKLFPGETLLAERHGSHAHAAVVERNGDRLIRVNNYYRLGGTGAMESERNQGRIPLMLHPEPRDVFFLGLGTGITAGAATPFPVERIRICELLPEVIDLARNHFREPAQGLFSDPRVNILAEDGRNCLMAQPETYDVIISDLFTPWKAGTGNLYTQEHYRNVRQRLNEGGLFAQWLPLYQLSEGEFAIIARTMKTVFDQVVLWRGDMYPEGPIVALVGMEEGHHLDPDAIIAHGRALADNEELPPEGVLAALLRFYVGNASQAGWPGSGPINTDNRPIIEYQAPQRQSQEDDQRFVGMPLARFYEQLLERGPPADDPYLARLDGSGHDYVQGGLSYYRYAVLRNEGHDEAASVFLEDFLARTPFEVAPEPSADDRAPSGMAD